MRWTCWTRPAAWRSAHWSSSRATPAGAHPLAHVFFESNDHAGGVGFLADWITAYDRTAPFFCHLSWHLALFEL